MLRSRSVQTFWNGVCGVLEPGHQHGEERRPESRWPEFTLLGIYEGFSVEARVVRYFDEWSYMVRSQVCLSPVGDGPTWWNLCFRPGFWRRPGSWAVFTPSKELERRLGGAGLIDTAERVLGVQEQYLSGISYAEGRLGWWSCNSEPPDVKQFRRFMDVLVSFAAVNDRVNY